MCTGVYMQVLVSLSHQRGCSETVRHVTIGINQYNVIVRERPLNKQGGRDFSFGRAFFFATHWSRKFFFRGIGSQYFFFFFTNSTIVTFRQ